MADNLENDQINRLWQHALHEDEVFNSRLNFFLVFESILLGVVGLMYGKSVAEMLMLRIFIVLGILVTIMWGYIQANQKHLLDILITRLKDEVPEYKITVEKRKQGWWPISGTGLLTYAIPS